MADNILEGSRILAISDGNVQRQVEFIADYKQQESTLKLKYYMWLSRFFIFLASISLMLFWCSSLALFRLAPQVSVKPFLIISQDNSEGIVRAEGMGMRMASRDKITETYVKQYVELRNTMLDDEMEMNTRWQPGGMINLLSAPNIFNAFSEYRDSVWEKLVKKGAAQEVEIVSTQRVGGQHSPIWKVDFKTYMLAPKELDGASLDKVMTTKYWTASVTALFVKDRMFMGRRLLNPLGFTVVRYSQTQVEGL